MSDEVEWSRIRNVIEQALGRPPGEREAFVSSACAGDEVLRGQVELMLSSVDEGSTVDEDTRAIDMQPILASNAPLIGRTLVHYEVTDKVGQGGMGEVYRAWDHKLQRDVAIKVLPTEFATDPRRLERFQREAQLLASVNHPNIATIHGVEEAQGIRFLVLEMVEGQGLDERIAQGPLEMEEATAVFRQIADALEAAHETGIIHRDLKPANVKITPRGHVKVLDFGLAKALGPLPEAPVAAAAARKSLPGETRVGTIVGTVAYMSPEQARGKPVDKRTDVWAFGCTLFEALTGDSPFRRPTFFETIAAIMERPPDLEALPAGTTGSTRNLLERCLEKDPENRLAGMRDAREALAPAVGSRSPLVWMLALGLLVVVAAVVGAWWIGRQPAGGAAVEDDTPRVAVTAPVNLTGRPELDWMPEGVALLVRGGLAESRFVAVVSKSRWDAIVKAAGADADVNRLAEQAGVDYLVSGEILSAPEGLILSARVSDVKRGVDLAARRIEGLTAESLLDASDRVSLLARQALNIPHTESVASFAADFAADHPAAYEAYVSGLEFFNGFEYDDAEQSFRAALELEPDFHIARYRLAYLLFLNGRTERAESLIDGIPLDAAFSRREQLYVDAARALIHWDLERAKAEYRTLLEEYPFEIEARWFLAEIHGADYDDEGALEQLRIISEHEPETAAVWMSLAETRLRLRRFDEAAQAIERYGALSPGDPAGFKLSGDLHRFTGQFELASVDYRRALELKPEFSFAKLGLAMVSALDGDGVEAERLWRGMVADDAEEPSDRIDAAFELSAALRAQGRFEESLEPLILLGPEILDEGWREASALAERVWSLIELGRLDEAARLATIAVERSEDAPTRALFARGMVELASGAHDAVRATAAAVRTHGRPPEEEDSTEEMAAGYLEGMAALAAGRPDVALGLLQSAASSEGFAYRLYGLGHASALHAAGRHAEAAQQAGSLAARRDPVEPRLDLELDRVRAGLVEAEALAATGERARARELARVFLDRWTAADPDHPDVVRARRLANDG